VVAHSFAGELKRLYKTFVNNHLLTFFKEVNWMNFHKTIGFLATLLLIVGLGVPDSFAQTGTMKLEFTETIVTSVLAGTENAPGGRWRLTLDPAPDAATTIVVNLSFPPHFPMTRDASVNPITPIFGANTYNGNINITVGTDGTGESEEFFIVDAFAGYVDFSYLHARVLEQTITAGGESVTYPGFFARQRIKDARRPTATNRITLEASLPSINANAGGQQTVTLTVTMDPAPETAVSLFMQANHMTPDGNWAASFRSDPNNVTISANATEGTTVYSFAGNANIPEGIVRMHASINGYNSATLDIPVISRDATDVTGYRVLLTAPGANAWKGIAKKAVTVEVVRADRIAYPWTEFSSIAVSLADTLVTDGATPPNPILIYTLTASGFTTATGDLTFSRARAENTVSPDPAFGKNADANEITYDVGADKLIFKRLVWVNEC